MSEDREKLYEAALRAGAELLLIIGMGDPSPVVTFKAMRAITAAIAETYGKDRAVVTARTWETIDQFRAELSSSRADLGAPR